ncbi:hypothetical protein A2U01_0038818, partial [Trifolium medium]|nr:hypothetical protein [Trifolium medium]
MVDYSALALNAFLEADVPARCAVENAMVTFKDWAEVRRDEIRDYVGRPGIQWMKYSGGEFPTKISLSDFQPVARAWGEFVVHNIAPVSNSSEYQVENALIVKMIMQEQNINLGQLLVKSIRKIANNVKPVFSLGHCNLITALCRYNGVPEPEREKPYKAIRAMTLRYFESYDDSPIVAQQPVARARGNRRAAPVREEPQEEEEEEEEDEDMEEIDRYG